MQGHFTTGTNVTNPIIIVLWWIVISFHHDIMHLSAFSENATDDIKVKNDSCDLYTQIILYYIQQYLTVVTQCFLNNYILF